MLNETITIKGQEYKVIKQGQAKWTYIAEIEGKKGARYILSIGSTFATLMGCNQSKGKKIKLTEIK